jgi:hypothetical protein
MKLSTLALIVATAVVPTAVMAEGSSGTPGASNSMNTSPGASQSAPGQKMLNDDKANTRGASEYAPGQLKKDDNTTTGSGTTSGTNRTGTGSGSSGTATGGSSAK